MSKGRLRRVLVEIDSGNSSEDGIGGTSIRHGAVNQASIRRPAVECISYIRGFSETFDDLNEPVVSLRIAVYAIEFLPPAFACR